MNLQVKVLIKHIYLSGDFVKKSSVSLDKKMKLREEYLIAYDIEDNKARTKIHKQLLAYGLKAVQKSVFWGCITLAELNAVKRLFDGELGGFDKIFVTRVNMQEQKFSYSFGYDDKSFKDWDEYGSI